MSLDLSVKIKHDSTFGLPHRVKVTVIDEEIELYVLDCHFVNEKTAIKAIAAAFKNYHFTKLYDPMYEE